MLTGLFFVFLVFSYVAICILDGKEARGTPCVLICCCDCICDYLDSIDKTTKKILDQLTGQIGAVAESFMNYFEEFHTKWPEETNDEYLVPGTIERIQIPTDYRVFVEPENRFDSVFNPFYVLFEDDREKKTYSEIADRVYEELKGRIEQGSTVFESETFNTAIINPPVAPTTVALRNEDETRWQAMVLRYIGLITGDPVDPEKLLYSADSSQRGEILREIMRVYVQRKLLSDAVLQSAGSIEASFKATALLKELSEPMVSKADWFVRRAPETLKQAILVIKQVLIIHNYLQIKLLEELAQANIMRATQLAHIYSERAEFYTASEKRLEAREGR